MNRKMRKAGPGDRITGSLDPFQTQGIISPFKEIEGARNAIPEVLIDEFREVCKIAVALRVRVAVNYYFANIVISQVCKDIITQFLEDNNCHIYVGFISCSMDYFSGEREHNLSLNLDCASCRAKDKKAIAHAREDCAKFDKRYIKKVFKKLESGEWRNFDEETLREKCEHYHAIENSIKIFTRFFCMLCNDSLPKTLGKDIYNCAIEYDEAVANHYNFNAGAGVYNLNKNGNHMLSVINMEAATYIICKVYGNRLIKNAA